MPTPEDWTAAFAPLQLLQAGMLARLREQSRVVELDAGTRVFGPGQSAAHFLLLLDGTIRVQQTSEAGREIVLYRVQAGESCVLTTACLLGEEDYQAEAIVERRARGVLVPRALFDELVAGSRDFRRFVFTAFSRRVTNLLRLIEEVAFARIDVRLAQRLLALADATGRIAATHQDLAHELGSAREVISRQVNEMQRRGWLRATRGTIEITDRNALARLAAQG